MQAPRPCTNPSSSKHPPPTPHSHLGHAHEVGHHAVHVGAAVRHRLLGARLAVEHLQDAVEGLELQARLLLRQLLARVVVGIVVGRWRGCSSC